MAEGVYIDKINKVVAKYGKVCTISHKNKLQKKDIDCSCFEEIFERNFRVSKLKRHQKKNLILKLTQWYGKMLK